MQSNCASQLNVYRKLHLFSNNMKNERIESICFKDMVLTMNASILSFIKQEHNLFYRLKDVLLLRPVDWKLFKRDYFLNFSQFKTAFELKTAIFAKLKSSGNSPNPKESFIVKKTTNQIPLVTQIFESNF